MPSIRLRPNSSTMRQTSIPKLQGIVLYVESCFLCYGLLGFVRLFHYFVFSSSYLPFSPSSPRHSYSFIPSRHPFFIAMLLSFSHHPITPSLFSPLLRVEFEAACEDLFERLTAPIDAALKMAGKTLSEVHSVELLG